MRCRRWMVLWLLVGLPLGLWAADQIAFVQDKAALQTGDLYQTDSRALAKLRTIPPGMEIVRNGDRILFHADAATLNALSTARVPFRKISGRPMPQQGPISLPDETDVIHPYVGVILNQVSPASYQNYLQTLQNFVTRNTYNNQADSAANWIRQTFLSFGLTVSLDTFRIGLVNKYNVVAEKPGVTQPNQVYFMTAHYDATAGLPFFPEASAPGADDDASGAAAVLESARVLSQYNFNKTVRFVIFCGNEQGLVGSEDYVSGLPTTQTYLGDFNADMIGYSGTDPWPPDLVIYHNGTPGSSALAGKISEAIGYYENGFLQPVLISDSQMVYSDHAPFWDRNIPAVVAMEDEAWGEDLNPRYHSTGDLLQYLDMSYAVGVMRVLLASLADLATPQTSPGAVLTAGSPNVNDSLGNGNHQIEYGEFIYLAMPVVNAGNSGATAVNVTIGDLDPYLTLVDSQQYYGTIPALDTVTVYNGFSADVSDSVPDEHRFTLNVSIRSGTSQWLNQIQMVAHAPNLVVSSVTVNDTTLGNGNGILEPGETADLMVTLVNEGSWTATNLAAALSTPSAYIIVQTASQAYGTLSIGGQAIRPYRVAAMINAPQYFQPSFNMVYSVSGGWLQRGGFTMNVGNPVHQPTGPDGHGYSAYDSSDAPFAPTYNWFEIDPGQGGQGTELNFTNGDQTLYVNLPFTFRYYGQNFTELSINSNGWIACGHTSATDYSNTTIPNPSGPSAMIAGFWDDLQPNITGSVSVYYDQPGARVIIEFWDVRHYSPSSAHETFQFILYNPTVHHTLTGDGEILIQYNIVALANSCTIGIESPNQQTGIQYLYNNAYASTATPIANHTAILFTTGRYVPQVQVDLTPINPPIQIPANGGTFNFIASLANHDTIPYLSDAWCTITLPNGSTQGPVLGPITLTLNPNITVSRVRSQSIAASSPPGNYFYNGYVGDYPDVTWSHDAFLFTKLTTTDGGPIIESWANWGEPFPGEEIAVAPINVPMTFCLKEASPNPFNPTTVIRYQMPDAGQVNLKVYDVSGRMVAKLAEGWKEAGHHQATFDGSRMASGIYFVRMQAGSFAAVRKMVLLK